MEPPGCCQHCGQSTYNTYRWKACALHDFKIADKVVLERAETYKHTRRWLNDALAEEADVSRELDEAEAKVDAIRKTLRDAMAEWDELSNFYPHVESQLESARERASDDDLALLRAKQKAEGVAKIVAVNGEENEGHPNSAIDRSVQEVRAFFKRSLKETGNSYGNSIHQHPKRRNAPSRKPDAQQRRKNKTKRRNQELTNHHCLPEEGIEGPPDPDIKSELTEDHHGTLRMDVLYNHSVKPEFVTEQVFETIPEAVFGADPCFHGISPRIPLAESSAVGRPTTESTIQTTLEATRRASKTAKSSPKPQHQDGDIMSYFTKVE